MKYPLFILALAGAGALAACGPKAETDAAQTPGPPPAESAGASSANSAMNSMSPPEAATAKTAKGAGTVTAVDTAAGTITINHGPIAEADWPAMTMGFKASPEQVASVKVGDKVTFDLKLEGGAGEITALSRQ